MSTPMLCRRSLLRDHEYLAKGYRSRDGREGSSTGGSRTHRTRRFELRRFASLRTAPFHSALSTRFELAISCVTGRRALRAAPRGHCVFHPVAQVGVEPTASLVLSQGGLPVAYRAKWSRMESNHRFLGVDQVSLPLDHGTVFLKWSHRESHSDFQRAMLASSFWTMTPMSLCSGSRETRTHKRLFAVTCFQDRLLIRPDGFRCRAAEAGIEPT